jgi:hypothetical protein
MQSQPPEADPRRPSSETAEEAGESVPPAGRGVLPPNLVILGGTVGAEPEVDRAPASEPVVRLRLDHPVPGEGDAPEGERIGNTSVIVPWSITDTYSGSLRAGATVLIVGHELGGGAVFADALIPTAL